MADVPNARGKNGGAAPPVTAAAAVDREAVRAINQRIFDTSPDLILVVDRQGNFIRVSPSSLSIIGYTADEMFGRNGTEFVHPEDLDNTRQEMRQARRSRARRDFECRYVHRDGHAVTLWWIGVWSEPEEQFFFIGRDMTERNEAERRLRDTEAHIVDLRDAIESMSEGFVIYDEEDRMVMCNAAYRRFYPENTERDLIGLRFEDMLRQGIASGRYPAAVGQEEAWIAERLRRHRNTDDRVEQQVGDGRWVLVTKHRMPNGWIAGLRVDISALKAAEAALTKSEARLALAAEVTEIGVGSALAATLPAQINARFNEIYGLPPDKREISAGELLRLIHPDDRDEVAAAVLPAIREGKLYRGEFRIRRANTGEERWVRAIIRTLIDPNGKLGYFLGVHIDVTEEKRAADQLRQAQKMEAIGNLTGGMAHDFNNLLGVIIGNLDMARPLVASNAEAGQLMQEAVDAAVSGAELTRRLLAFARQQPLRPECIEANALVTNIVRLLRRTLGENIEIMLDLGDALWPVVADPVQLEAALTNLATNARDAMPRGGRLVIATANRQLDPDYAAAHAEVIAGDYVAVEVTDSGTGMPPEVADQIFEPFFTTKEQGKGTGLGLSMVFGFIKQSGGHINVYSEVGKGTTFRLYLPRATSETAAPTETVKTAAPSRGGGETVLAVEDNERLRRLVMRQLRALGYQPIEAVNAVEALSILERQPVDVLFSDIVMPGDLDGIELAQEVRKRWPSIKVVLTSGFPGARLDDQLGPQNGVVRILSKPYRSEELGAALREVLGR